MIDWAIDRLKKTSFWHLLWVSILSSEVITFITVFAMSLLFHGTVRGDFMITGAVTALIASAMIVSIIIVLVKRLDRSEAALSEQTALYHKLVELAPDAVLVHSGGRIVFVNPAGLEMLGAEAPSQLLGKPVIDIVHPDFRQEVAKRIGAMISNRARVPMLEEKIIRLDGAELDVEVAATYIEYEGKPSVMVAARDISMRKRAEDAIMRAKEEAEAVSKAKSEFLSSTSHELRTPLCVIMGFTQLLGRTNLSNEQKLYVNTIESSNDTLLTLINDILDYSGLERGREPRLEYIWVDLKETVSGVARTISPKAEGRGLGFVLAYEGPIPRRVKTDPARLGQIIANLADNAVKFTEKGMIGIKVCASAEQNGRASVQFTVHDTGIGIPTEKQERIFESFTQADGSMTRKYGGLGLGTTISKMLVNMMGGKIWVESQPGKGSRFHFTIPFQCENGGCSRGSNEPHGDPVEVSLFRKNG